MKIRVILLPLLLIAYLAVSGQSKTALVIIDIQEFYFPGGDAELVNPGEASKNAAKILQYFRDNGDLVVHVRHNYEPGGDIHKNVKPVKGEKIISKDYANSFRETDLESYLVDHGIEELVITGMQTHMCVEATTRAAADKGFSCIVISDACTTRGLKFADKVIDWESVHYSTLSTLKGGYAKVMPTKEYFSR